MEEYRIKVVTHTDEESSEIIAFGSAREEMGSRIIEYSDEDADMRIVIGGGLVSIVRNGEAGTVLTFEEGKTHEAEIATSFGILPFTITTKKLQIVDKGGDLALKLGYISDLGGEPVRFDVTIDAEKMKQ